MKNVQTTALDAPSTLTVYLKCCWYGPRAARQRYEGDNRTLDLCKRNRGSCASQRRWSSEQSPSDADVQRRFSVCGRQPAVHCKEETEGRERQVGESFFLSTGSASYGKWRVRYGHEHVTGDDDDVVLQLLDENAELPFLRHSTLVLTCFVLFFSFLCFPFLILTELEL